MALFSQGDAGLGFQEVAQSQKQFKGEFECTRLKRRRLAKKSCHWDVLFGTNSRGLQANGSCNQKCR